MLKGLDQNCLCGSCMGCSLLETRNFRGKAECSNYVCCYSDKERAERLRKEQKPAIVKYGSMYGNNN